MSDLVRDLLFRASDQDGIGRTPTTVVHVPAGLLHRAADEIERLNRELDDVWDALAIQREDNASFGDAFKRMTSEIERLRAALDTVRASGLLIGSTTLHDRVRSAVYNAIDANPAALEEAPCSSS